MEYTDNILILTPMKDAEEFLEQYIQLLSQLIYPHHLISMGFLESDSSDNTFTTLQQQLPELQQEFRSAHLWKKDFGFLSPSNTPRWSPQIQIQRRSIIAKSRNHLLFHALNDEDWVLWIDVDVIDYPPDIIERLLATEKEIVVPNCVKEYGGPTFDLNAWRDKGTVHIHDLRQEGELVKLHAVGGTMLLIKADIHRDGLIFPSFLYGKPNPLIRNNNGFIKKRVVLKKLLLEILRGTFDAEAFTNESVGEIDTEGLGIMAHDMGQECWAMPRLEIRHIDA